MTATARGGAPRGAPRTRRLAGGLRHAKPRGAPRAEPHLRHRRSLDPRGGQSPARSKPGAARAAAPIPRFSRIAGGAPAEGRGAGQRGTRPGGTRRCTICSGTRSKRFSPSRLALDGTGAPPNTVGRSLKQWFGGLLRPHVDPDDQRQWQPDQGRLSGAPDPLNQDTRAGFRAMGGSLGLATGRSNLVEPIHCLVCLVVKARPPAGGGAGGELRQRRAGPGCRRGAPAIAGSRPAGPGRAPREELLPFSPRHRRAVPPVPVIGCGFDEVTLKAVASTRPRRCTGPRWCAESVDYGR
jgi:hypothetical protein